MDLTMAHDDYGIVAAPHGAHPRDTQDIRHDMSANEASVFHALLHPDDLYDENGTYWADLPLGRRLKFVTKANHEEAQKERRSFWEMVKADPLSPIGYYLKNMVLPGAGLGLEG